MLLPVWVEKQTPDQKLQMTTSLIGHFGQVRFFSLLGIIIAHLGHASLRSLGVATWGIAARMCRIGCGEPRLETRLDGAAVIFGFFHRPRPVRTIPFRLVLEC